MVKLQKADVELHQQLFKYLFYEYISCFLPEVHEGGGAIEVEYPPFEWLLSPKSKIGLGLGVYSRLGRD